ncbi:MAG: hypothetical protein ACUVSX_12440 [Aggregatilineales bacterium]
MRFRQRNLPWAAALALLVAIVAVSGAASAEVLAVVAGLAGLGAAASLVELQPVRLRQAMPPSPLARMRMSADAREAVDRARRRGSQIYSSLTLMDIGVISAHTTAEGMVMRKSRSVSGDDDGVRPFVTLHVRPEDADRNALVRFEIIDHNGQRQYVHEMKVFLRDGEMNILADHHLPLADNPQLATTGGEWDLRVSIDGMLAGALSFNVSPSLRARERQLAQATRRVGTSSDQSAAEDAPIRLEDLLRGRHSDRTER